MSLRGLIFLETYNARGAALVALFRMLNWKPNSCPIRTTTAIEIPSRGNFSESGKTADFAGILRDPLSRASSTRNCKNVDTDNLGDKSVGFFSEALPAKPKDGGSKDSWEHYANEFRMMVNAPASIPAIRLSHRCDLRIVIMKRRWLFILSPLSGAVLLFGRSQNCCVPAALLRNCRCRPAGANAACSIAR